jgi:hypothetical protein
VDMWHTARTVFLLAIRQAKNPKAGG